MEASAPASLTTASYFLQFNQDYPDGSRYFILNVLGLEGAPIRAPTEDAPQTDGGLKHNFFEGPRHITVEGLFITATSGSAWNLVARRNQMEDDLRLALKECLRLDGLWSWAPTGLPPRELVVRNDMPLVSSNTETMRRSFSFGNTFLKTFTFGLYAPSPDF